MRPLVAPTQLGMRQPFAGPLPFQVRWIMHEYVCGLPHCGADHMTRSEYRTHLAMTHDRVVRKPLPLAVRYGQ